MGLPCQLGALNPAMNSRKWVWSSNEDANVVIDSLNSLSIIGSCIFVMLFPSDHLGLYARLCQARGSGAETTWRISLRE